MQQIEKYLNKINLIALGALIVVLVIGIIVAFTPQVNNLNKYQEIKLANEEKIEQLQNQERQLKENINRLIHDPNFVEQVAHEKGYAREDETIFYFPDDKKIK